MFSLFAFYASMAIGSLLFLYYKPNLLAWLCRRGHELIDHLKNNFDKIPKWNLRDLYSSAVN